MQNFWRDTAIRRAKYALDDVTRAKTAPNDSVRKLLIGFAAEWLASAEYADRRAQPHMYPKE